MRTTVGTVGSPRLSNWSCIVYWPSTYFALCGSAMQAAVRISSHYYVYVCGGLTSVLLGLFTSLVIIAIDWTFATLSNTLLPNSSPRPELSSRGIIPKLSIDLDSHHAPLQHAICSIEVVFVCQKLPSTIWQAFPFITFCHLVVGLAQDVLSDCLSGPRRSRAAARQVYLELRRSDHYPLHLPGLVVGCWAVPLASA